MVNYDKPTPTVDYDEGLDEDTGMLDGTYDGRPADHVRDAQLAQAKYLGADAALAAASWLTMSEDDARSILDDVDPEVMDRYREPNLSGEWADDPTPASLHYEITGEHVHNDATSNVAHALADAWEAGRDEVWGDALQAHALRALGDVVRALDVEQRLERHVAALRVAAGGDEQDHPAFPL